MIGQALWRKPSAALWAAGAAAVLVGATVLGWRSGQASDLARAAAAPSAWELPQTVAENPERDAAVLRTRHPWGGRASFHDIDAAPVAQPWTLVGTVLRDEGRYALIRVGPPTGKIEYRSIGEKLPDGSTVDKIDADGITTAGGPGRGGRPTLYRLFDKKS
jgi:hypothetical protein